MIGWLVVLSFVAAAALSWGVYVPDVHRAAFELKSNLRAFMFVGVAYFVVAVLIPAFFIFVAKSDPTVFSIRIPSHAASLNSVEERIMQPGDLGPFSSGAQLRLGVDLQGT